jgi:predicted dinucleotide-binding enzyme
VKVAVVGAGRIGGNVARRLGAAGHDVVATFSRDPEGLAARAAELGVRADPDPAAAVRDADVVVLSVPWSAIPVALEQVGSLAGKVVVDTTNQFGAGPGPSDGQTAAAFNAGRMPGARYTKCFNTLTAAFQEATAHRTPPVVQWLCGDDAAAKALVAGLVRDAGYAPVDLGGTTGCAVMESPRRAGAVYGEEYRPADAEAVVAAVRDGRPIPPTPAYPD